MSVWKWDKIFFRRKKVHSEGEECTESKRLEDFERQIGLLLHSDRFIARSDYRPIHERYAELHVSLSNLEKMIRKVVSEELKKAVFIPPEPAARNPETEESETEILDFLETF